MNARAQEDAKINGKDNVLNGTLGSIMDEEGNIVFLKAVEKEYLKKVLTDLEKIESATYYVTNESWQPGDSTALSTLHGFIKEYDNPMDSTIGASYVSLDANDTTKLEFCYDGNIRALPYHENKKLAIDDFTFRPLPFRLVSLHSSITQRISSDMHLPLRIIL